MYYTFGGIPHVSTSFINCIKEKRGGTYTASSRDRYKMHGIDKGIITSDLAQALYGDL